MTQFARDIPFSPQFGNEGLNCNAARGQDNITDEEQAEQLLHMHPP